MSDEGGGTEDGTSVVVVSGDDYSSSVQLQTMESHDLPTELTSADLESLANNPSLWLGLDGSLVGNSELSTLQATEIASVDIDGLSHAPATITLDNMCETEMSYVGVESLEEEIIQSQEIEESMEIVPANEEPYVEDIECSMEVEVGAHEECEVQAPQIVLKPPAPVQRSFIAQPKKAAGQTTQYILNQSTGQTILFTSKPSTSTPTSITLPVTAGGTQSFRLISPAKTLTLAQAQQMGLISPKKQGQTLIVNKLALPNVIKPAAQTGLKPTSMTVVKTGPAKIAPAPSTAGTTAVTLVGGMQQPILLTASPASGSQLIMKSSSTPIRMVTAITPNKIVAKSQPAATFGSVRPAGATPVRPNTPTTHYIRIPASQALAAGLVPAGPQLQLASGGGKIQLVRLVGSAGMSPNKGPRAVLQGTQMRHIAPLPGTQTIVRMATPHQLGNASKTVTVVSKGTTVSAASRLLLSTASFGGNSNSNVVMLPASVLSSSFVTQVNAASGIMTTAVSRVATATTTSSATQIKPKEVASAKMTASSQSQQQAGAGGAVGQSSAPQIRAIVESNGLRPRKPCNCTKSQCLKLYCDCFANGEFCYQCNCVNCFNNLSHEEERQKSIKQCLDRNPNAFRPKIGKSSGDSRRHNKGCHCKRSGCLKNYCECYEAKICCTDACRCIGCKNVDEYVDRKPLKEALDAEPRLPTPAGRVKMPVSSADAASPHDYFPGSVANTVGSSSNTRGGASGITTIAGTNAGPRPAFSFVTQEVVEATCQCLLARAEEAQEAGKTVADTQVLVLEEFGRCLLQIIDYANKAKGSPS